jgi:hypothetical protein
MTVRLLHLSRWEVLREGGLRPALALVQLPSPTCPACFGDGGWEEGSTYQDEPEMVPCWCTTDLRRYRLRLPLRLACLLRCGWCRTRPCTCSTEPPF